MKHMSKVIVLLLALCMLVSLVACGNKQDNQNGQTTTTSKADAGTTTTSTPEITTTAPPTDANGYLLDQIPEELDYKGKVVNVMFDKGQMNKTYVQDLTGDLVNDALYNRLATVKERLGVEFNFIPVDGAWAKRAEFAAEVQRSVQSGDKAYDLVCAYNLTPPTMAVQGTLTNLYDQEYLNFDQPWWPQNLLKQSVVGNKLFFCADNSSYNVIRNMHVIAYETNLVKDFQIPDPMATVIAGDWTMDLLEQYIVGTYKDLNGDGKKDAADQFGLATDTSARLDGYFFGAGLTYTKLDANGMPYFTLDGEDVLDFVDRLTKLYRENPDVIIDSAQYKMFKEQRAVFYETAIAIVDQKLPFEYGILPIPKYTSEQEEYVTGMSNTHDVWCVPSGVEDAEMCAAILECLASEAYRQVAPVYFETALKIKYASDSQAGQVYDIIRAGMTFDFGYIYGNNMDPVPFTSLRKCITGGTSWATTWQSMESVVTQQLADIVEALKNN